MTKNRQNESRFGRIFRGRGPRLLLVVLGTLALLVWQPETVERPDPSAWSMPVAPSWEHPLGTDDAGLDRFEQTLVGLRTTLGTTLVAALSGIGLAALLLFLASFGARAASIVRILQRQSIVLPPLLLAMLLRGAEHGPLAAVALFAGFRLAGALLDGLEEDLGHDWITTTRALGASQTRVFLWHLMRPAIARFGAFYGNYMAELIGFDAGLSMLGIGTDGASASQAGLGRLIILDLPSIPSRPWLSLGPALVLVLVCLAFISVSKRQTISARKGPSTARRPWSSPDRIERLACSALTISYGERRVVDIDRPFELERGITCIVGPSGHGKSTLVHWLTGTLSSDASVHGTLAPVPGRAQLAFVPQLGELPPWRLARRTIRRDWALRGADGLGLRSAFAKVGLGHRWSARPPTLSQGEHRRALALRGDPAPWIVYDEPLAGLDRDRCEKLVDLLRRQRDAGKGVIVVTHEIDPASTHGIAALADHLLVLDRGRLDAHGRASDLLAHATGLLADMLATFPPVGGPSQRPLPELEFHDDGSRTLTRCTDAGGPPPVPPDAPVVLSVRDVHRVFVTRRRPVTALAPTTFDVRRGECVGIRGPSGGGKTTLARILAGLDRATSGSVMVEGGVTQGHAVGVRTKEAEVETAIGYLPQGLQALDPGLTVAESLEHARLLRGSRPLPEGELDLILKVLRLEDKVGRRPTELSGGERQRAGLARLLVRGCSILVLDEPEASLDACLRAAVVNLILDLIWDRRITILWISHQDRLLEHTCDRVLTIRLADDGDGAFDSDSHPR